MPAVLVAARRPGSSAGCAGPLTLSDENDMGVSRCAKCNQSTSILEIVPPEVSDSVPLLRLGG